MTSAAAAKFARFLHRVGEYLNYIAFFAVLIWIWFDDLITVHNPDIGEIVESTVWRIVYTTMLVHFVSWLLKKLQYVSEP